MKKQLLATIITCLRWYIGTGIFDRISEKVQELMAVDITGTEKRQIVIDFAKGEYNFIKTNAIAAIIEITLLKENNLKETANG